MIPVMRRKLCPPGAEFVVQNRDFAGVDACVEGHGVNFQRVQQLGQDIHGRGISIVGNDLEVRAADGFHIQGSQVAAAIHFNRIPGIFDVADLLQVGAAVVLTKEDPLDVAFLLAGQVQAIAAHEADIHHPLIKG